MRKKTAVLTFAAMAFAGLLIGGDAMAQQAQPDAAKIDLHWGVKIPLRDGVRLAATLYTPKEGARAPGCIFTLTPYVAQQYHDRGVYFAARGFPFLTVDVRGRGDSEGVYRPLIQEAKDGYDIVEWLAKQPYCNGKVAMWGGSYGGYDQWATAKEKPPHLTTILPIASAYPGADLPYRNNIISPYMLQWLLFTGGRALQMNIFSDGDFWSGLWRERFEKGEPFSSLAGALGLDQPILAEWIAHPEADAYWDGYVASQAQMRKLDIPILSVTGAYDTQQAGALAWYKSYMRVASPEQRARHFLVIGPWDHAGTRSPRAEVGGVKFGPASLVDRSQQDLDWYRWTIAGGPKPEFLKAPVAYYVAGAERWRHADSLEAVTAASKPYFLDSTRNATRVLASGELSPALPGKGRPDQYVYDPRDVSTAALETQPSPNYLTDQRMVFARDGGQLVYHTAAFETPTEVSGFFRLSAWIAIDQPDTDFQASVYEIDANGQSILLASDHLRARYREGLRQAKLVKTKKALRYDFDHFTFVSRQIAKGSRLRLVVGPINSIRVQKNYNSGKPVSEETMADARPVTVKLLHDRAHPSALYVPIGQP